MTMDDYSSEFRRIFEEKGSRETAKMYGRSQRTVQRWYKQGIPQDVARPITLDKDQKNFEWQYEKAKQKRGGLKEMAQRYKVSVRTLQRWKQKGIPVKAKKRPKGVRGPYKRTLFYAEVKYRQFLRGGRTIDKYWTSSFFIKWKDAVKRLRQIELAVTAQDWETDQGVRASAIMGTKILSSRVRQKSFTDSIRKKR